jgi:hypothetical protein
MPCPFPGMDPFLELPPYWSDFAPKLLASMSYALLPQVLPKYEVRIEEYLIVEQDEERLRRVQPDVTISTGGDYAATESAVAVADATMVELEYPELEPHRQRRLVLIHQLTGQVVTVIELLSPSNKATGEGGIDSYAEKRAELLASQAHVVELDLLRGGQRLPMSGPLPRGDYYAFVGRVQRRPRCQVIAWPLRAPLPAIPVPLLPEDPEVSLDLAAAFRAAYEPSLYDRRLPYDQPLSPPLSPADEAWLRERIAAARKSAKPPAGIGVGSQA